MHLLVHFELARVLHKLNYKVGYAVALEVFVVWRYKHVLTLVHVIIGQGLANLLFLALADWYAATGSHAGAIIFT